MNKDIRTEYDLLKPHLNAGEREELESAMTSTDNWRKAGIIAVGITAFLFVAMHFFG